MGLPWPWDSLGSRDFCWVCLRLPVIRVLHAWGRGGSWGERSQLLPPSTGVPEHPLTCSCHQRWGDTGRWGRALPQPRHGAAPGTSRCRGAGEGPLQRLEEGKAKPELTQNY